ncbi:hypothetical protein [Candidatus Nardonella dryophthoridicola]|uniref:Uncharacterized protein n=1 Tax=endosymbiont of Metamasius hemipterus TaxID=204627 RepID=A0ABT0TW98_9GAMM|nr:hypothetical protein [Candidatus Nardonella dryophthoridicola]MCM0158271.1 hypothetical protein [endosymbiont of Metamasius hemipterus]
MIEIFNIKKINKSFKIIDNKKIYYINKKIIKNMNIYKLKKELFLFIKKYKQNKIKLLLNKNFDIYYFLKIYKYRSSSLLDFILLNNFIFKKK